MHAGREAGLGERVTPRAESIPYGCNSSTQSNEASRVAENHFWENPAKRKAGTCLGDHAFKSGILLVMPQDLRPAMTTIESRVMYTRFRCSS